MKLKADVACNFYRLIETEWFLKVTDSHVHCKVVISRKQCMTETLLLQTVNRKWYTTYRTAAIPMTLSDLQGHSPVQVFSYGIFCTVLQQLTGLLTCMARSYGDSWASWLCSAAQRIPSLCSRWRFYLGGFSNFIALISKFQPPILTDYWRKPDCWQLWVEKCILQGSVATLQGVVDYSHFITILGLL